MTRRSKGARLPDASRTLRRKDASRPPLRKALGQYLLVSEGILEAVIAAADLDGSETVVEVGPGTGLLTNKLARAARRVIAVEVDPAMARHLREELREVPNVTLIEGDILAQDPAALAGGAPYLVVANLPYYVATPTIRLFLESAHQPLRMVVMVQREVAKEMVAPPGQAGLLTVGVQVYADVRIVRRVRPGSFTPPPKVESAIVRLEMRPEPLVPRNLLPAFFTVVRAGFSAPRKQLRNALANGLDMAAECADAWLAIAGIDSRRRAESLSIPEWRRLVEVKPLETQR